VIMSSLFETFFGNLLKHGLEYFRLYYSEYDGTCVDNEDPKEQGRIKVRVPHVAGNDPIGVWAWPKARWAGRNCGDFCVPDVDDPVIVTFRNGNPSYPRYAGGWWPNVGGQDNFTPTGAYVDGKPVVRIFRTKAGHELSFSDEPGNLGCKFIWHDPEGDKYSFIAFTAEGNIQMATHVGSFLEMRTKEGEEANLFVDKDGNSIIQDKDGIKIAEKTGNVIELKEGAIQIIGQKDVIINSQSVNMKTGGVTIGDVATDSAVKGTSWMLWWNSAFLPWLNAHTHGTGVGPSSPPLAPTMAPADKLVLTDKLKMQ
jgi:hypothetical protein